MNSLTHSEQDLLCGRAHELQVLLDNCAAGRATVVSAKPCFGVTSFLEAGARPALEKEGCLVVSFREWTGRYFVASLRKKVVDAISQKLGAEFSLEGELAGGGDLDDILHRGCVRTGCRIVLILDQFEDYLRCHTSPDVTDSFDSELGRATRLMGAAPILFGLQDHALATFDRLRQTIPNLFGGHIQLGPLTHDDARVWMNMEGARRSMDVEPAAVEAMVSSTAAASGAGIDPFLFSTGLHRLIDAEIRMRSGALRASSIQEYGGADRLILESLDSTLADLSNTHAELFFRWCNILISPELHRQSVTERALTDYAGKLNRFVLTLLPILIGNNILRSLEVRDGIRYEIARDRLVPIIRNWWERREATIVARRRAQFRVRSISVAAGTIVALYFLWLFLSK